MLSIFSTKCIITFAIILLFMGFSARVNCQYHSGRCPCNNVGMGAIIKKMLYYRYAYTIG
jgi:hypothetical protein